jgi:hypothetical protein
VTPSPHPILWRVLEALQSLLKAHAINVPGLFLSLSLSLSDSTQVHLLLLCYCNACYCNAPPPPLLPVSSRSPPKISGDSCIIGSFHGNDVVIAEAGVLPIHAKIERDGESYVLWDLSHDTLLSTRVALMENVEITVGSMLLLGNTRLVVTEYVDVVCCFVCVQAVFPPPCLCCLAVVRCCLSSFGVVVWRCRLPFCHGGKWLYFVWQHRRERERA